MFASRARQTFYFALKFTRTVHVHYKCFCASTVHNISGAGIQCKILVTTTTSTTILTSLSVASIPARNVICPAPREATRLTRI